MSLSVSLRTSGNTTMFWIFRGEFVWNWYYLFLNYLVEFFSEFTWPRCFLCGKIFNCKSRVFNRYTASQCIPLERILSFKEFVFFIQAVKFHSRNLFIRFLLAFWMAVMMHPLSFLAWVLSVFFLTHPARGSSIFFSQRKFLVSLIFLSIFCPLCHRLPILYYFLSF